VKVIAVSHIVAPSDYFGLDIKNRFDLSFKWLFFIHLEDFLMNLVMTTRQSASPEFFTARR